MFRIRMSLPQPTHGSLPQISASVLMHFAVSIVGETSPLRSLTGSERYGLRQLHSQDRSIIPFKLNSGVYRTGTNGMKLGKIIGRIGFAFGLLGPLLFYSSPYPLLYESRVVCPACPYIDIAFATKMTWIEVG